MKRFLAIWLSFCCSCLSAGAQSSSARSVLFIDSLPLVQRTLKSNPIVWEEIADSIVIRNRDSLQMLGWPDMENITYLFTKEYRRRPDSLKKIPSLKQMVFRNNAWHLNDTLYTGRYIDYYNSGRIQNEGTLVNGKVNGPLTMYFWQGGVKSILETENGIMHGIVREFHKNGNLKLQRNISYGRYNGNEEAFYYNGQAVQEGRGKKATPYDSIIIYFSTGQVKEVKLLQKGKVVRKKKDNEREEYSRKFQEALALKDLKTANKNFYKLWLLDSNSIETHYKEVLLLSAEFRFAESIQLLDKVLQMEPFLLDALLLRAINRMKMHHPLFQKEKQVGQREPLLTTDAFSFVPEEDIKKICSDFQLAQELDANDNFVVRIIPEKMLRFCADKTKH